MCRISSFVFVCFLSVVTGKAWSMSMDTVKDNHWYSVKPAWKFLPGLSGGHYQDRGWCTMRYNSKTSSILFYEGYTRSTDCIYANSLYDYQPLADSVKMRAISNWACAEHTVGPALAENSIVPTPRDRHTYAQFAYVASNDRLYIAHGAMGTNHHQHDFWAYALDQNKWFDLGAAPGGTAEWDCTCEKNLIYREATNELFFFATQSKVYAYSIASATWRTLTPKTAGSQFLGAHGLYDPKRDVFAFYGNNWDAADAGTDVFLVFDPKNAQWTAPTRNATWPPAQSYAALEYNTKWDVYMLHGAWGQSDTWVYFPKNQIWSKVTADGKPSAITNRGTYVAYDPAHDMLVSFAQGSMWMMRYRPDGSLIGTAAREGLIGKNLRVRADGPEIGGLEFRDLNNRLAPAGTRASGLRLIEAGGAKSPAIIVH